jgi:hypothetical protein
MRNAFGAIQFVNRQSSIVIFLTPGYYLAAPSALFNSSIVIRQS